jgi:hypothetical protein
MIRTSAKRTPAFYLSVAAGILFFAATITGLAEHGVDQKAGAAILGGLLLSVLVF